MKELEFSVETILELMDKMAKTNLGILELENGDLRFRLEAKPQPAPAVIAQSGAPIELVPAAPECAPAEPVAPAKEEKANECASGVTVTAPIVGTFYSAPGPDKESFVKVGQSVKKGDVLFIIESMKLMNEVQSECDGVVSQIFVKSGEGVEYGQPILIIQ